MSGITTPALDRFCISGRPRAKNSRPVFRAAEPSVFGLQLVPPSEVGMTELDERLAVNNGILAIALGRSPCTCFVLHHGCPEEDEEVCAGLTPMSLIDSGFKLIQSRSRESLGREMLDCRSSWET